MTGSPNAVELTVEQAWLLADTTGAGSFPWVLAITPPYADPRARGQFDALSADATAVAAEWVRTVCRCDQWLELRYIWPDGRLLRGVIARRGAHTVVALRTAHLVTFTAMTVDHPHALVPIVVAGLARRKPARFDEFALPARVGARADEQLRSGAKVTDVIDFLGIPPSARPVVEAVFTGPRSYVEIAAGQRRDGREATSEVGVGIVDATAGRILVSPHRAADGEWISTFAPGGDLQIAVALERLTETLPDGRWFPDAHLTREFITQSS